MYVQIRLMARDHSVDDKYVGGDCLNGPFFVSSMSSLAVSYQSVGDVIFIFLIYL